MPIEIRLQIYHYVLLSHPGHHAHLAPINPTPDLSGLNTEEFHTSMARAGGPKAIEIVSRTITSKPSYITTTLTRTPQARVQGKIPTSLLLSCRQIFAESHQIPWQTNTFAFINWFWSGVYAARQFTRNLPAWQCSQMRHVSIEVLGRDLWIGARSCIDVKSSNSSTGRKEGKGVDEWRELCRLWKGVWSLKLVVKGSLFVDTPTPKDSSAMTGAAVDLDFLGGRSCILDSSSEWVTDGLLALSSLRCLELEFEDGDVSREDKLAFCAELENVLNSGEMQAGINDGWMGQIRVAFLERVKVVEKPVSTRGYVSHVGEPGDEIPWGADLRTTFWRFLTECAVGLFWTIFSGGVLS